MPQRQTKSQLGGGGCMYKAELLSLLLKRARNLEGWLRWYWHCNFFVPSSANPPFSITYRISNWKFLRPTAEIALPTVPLQNCCCSYCSSRTATSNSESTFHDWDSALYISAIYLQQNHYPRASSKSRLWHCLIYIRVKLKTFFSILVSSESGTDYKLEKSWRANGCSHSPVCRFTTDICFLNKAALARKQPNR